MVLNYFATSPVQLEQSSTMSSYAENMLTPPSSSEDSPQAVFYLASPNSNSFQGPEGYSQGTQVYAPQIEYNNIEPKNEIVVDANTTMDIQRTFLQIVEQPTDRFRFRYKSEMAGTHGSLTGLNSDKSRKTTYPTVQLHNGTGNALVRCSIYQVDSKGKAIKKEGMPHAHRLIMKKGKDEVDDPHDMIIGPEDDYRAIFHGMGIIHTAKKNLLSELVKKKTKLKKEKIAREEGKSRELTTKEAVEIKGLAESESKSINLNIVCLRFDAFVEQNGILFPICDPVYSHGINNLKSALTGDLKIVRLDHCVSPATGNKEIFILVERVTKKNIKIRFYELDDNEQLVWEDWGRFNDLDVHHQYAIVFKTPKYKDEDITKPVHVFVELLRPSDNARSEPRDFRFIPNKREARPGQKRPRTDYSSSIEYESSNVGSEDLPAVISSMHIAPAVNPNPATSSLNGIPSGLSDEIKKAIDNINSDEFEQLFSEHQEDYSNLLGLDAPQTTDRNRSKSKSTKTTESSRQELKRRFIKIEVSPEDKRMASRAIEELRSFVRSKHTPNDAQKCLNYYLSGEKTNALHVSVCQNDIESTIFLLKVILYYERFDIINTANDDGQTPLQLAVLCHNNIIVNWLVKCRATIGTVDINLDTALHLAVKENVDIAVLEVLLKDWEFEKAKDFIDLKNKDGKTALFLAIDKNNAAVVKLLISKGADINVIEDKHGFTPLRYAIEKQNYEITRYFLSLPDVQPLTPDFGNITPFQAGLQKSQEISDLVQRYMTEHHLSVDIKEEIEEESDEEMDEDTKPWLMSSEALKPLYDKVKRFSSQCLEDVAQTLDASGNWGSLAELLAIDHLIDTGVIQSDKSMSKALLAYAVEKNNDTLWMIRNFLENLDELVAVEIMDRMVYEVGSAS